MRRVFRILGGPRRIRREVDDELAFHLEMRTRRLMETGMTRDAAEREALRQFGDVDTVRQGCVTMDEQRERASSRANLFAEARQDVAYSLRSLARNAGFAAVVVIALAAGIGASTAIFTLIDAVLLRTLPVAHPEQLVVIGNPARVGGASHGGVRTDLLSYPLYRDVRERNHVFRDVSATGRTGRIDARIDETGGELEHPSGRFVSGNYFSVLGVGPAHGRLFDGGEDQTTGASPVAVISDAYWSRRFRRDPSAVGRTIVVDGSRLTIIGVARTGFTGEIVGIPTDIWIPVTMQDVLRPNDKMLTDRTADWLIVVGRLAPGATLAQARQEIPELIERAVVAGSPGTIAQTFLSSAPRYYVQSGATGVSRLRLTFQAPLLTLMAGVVLLLCIVCANVATLLLARSIARGREMAVRLTLGANRGRLVRQLLTESAVLAALGATAGSCVAWWGSRGLLALSGGAQGSLDLGIDLRVLGFTVGASVGAVLLFGLAPALRAARVDLAATMRAGATAVSRGGLGARGQRAPLGRLLIVSQVALSVVLLSGAAMLVRSLRNVRNVDVGLDREHLIVADLDITARGYRWERTSTLATTLRDRLSALPGVRAVAFSENGVFSGNESSTTIEMPGFAPRSSDDTVVAYDQVSAGYTTAIGGRLVGGRELGPRDEGALARTVVVNEAFANFYFPNGRAVGKYFHISDSLTIQIAGVVSDVRDHSLTEPPPRRVYFPFVHHDAQLGTPVTFVVEVRTAGDPADLVQAVRRTVAAVDPDLPIDAINPLTTLMQDSIRAERLVAQLAAAFGVLALLLAAIGLYGVMSYATVRRTGEIGLRVALGARQSDVLRLVVREAMVLVVAGVAIGLPLAFASSRLLRTQLHGVSPTDAPSMTAAAVVLIVSGLAATLLPAVRASRVSPTEALRAE